MTPPAEFVSGMTQEEHYSLWREWDIHLRRLADERDALLRPQAIAASEAHAAAQQATADAMAASVAAQPAMAAAISGSGIDASFMLDVLRLVLKDPRD